MALGTRHIATGRLSMIDLSTYAMELDGGGVWRLDMGLNGDWHPLLEKRVTVEGIRTDFDVLQVKRLWEAGAEIPTAGHLDMWARWDPKYQEPDPFAPK